MLLSPYGNAYLHYDSGHTGLQNIPVKQKKNHAPITQWSECGSHKAEVASSNLAGRTIKRPFFHWLSIKQNVVGITFVKIKDLFFTS